MENTEKFFEKYEISLTDWNAVDRIAHAAKKAQSAYEKDEEKGLKKLAVLHCMIEDWFEAKGENIKEYYEVA